MKISITKIAGFTMPGKHIITVTDSNENNLNSDSGFCILFYTKHKHCDRLDNYAWNEKIEYEKKVQHIKYVMNS